MQKTAKVVYDKETFYLQSSGRYFSSGRKDVDERLLHRRVWADKNGPIPDGHVVHHIDGDWKNNRIENLALMPHGAHASEHVAERWQDPQQAKKFLSGLEKARKKAPEWHKSKEGRLWHVIHGLRTWKNRKQKVARCVVCHDDFKTPFPSRAKFCSKSCFQKDYFQKHKTAKGKCARCGAEFTHYKYREQTFCSRSCSARSR